MRRRESDPAQLQVHVVDAIAVPTVEVQWGEDAGVDRRRSRIGIGLREAHCQAAVDLVVGTDEIHQVADADPEHPTPATIQPT